SLHPLMMPGVLASALIASGSTMAAGLGGMLLYKLIGTRSALDRPVDAFKFIFVTAVSCAVASTVGVLALHGTGFVPFEHLRATWRTWWAGDVCGVLVFTSLALTWRR